MRVDPCESLPILGIITSHLHPKERKKEQRGERKSLERESTQRGVSHSKNYPKPPLKTLQPLIYAYSNAQGAQSPSKNCAEVRGGRLVLQKGVHASRGSITCRAVWSHASATWRPYPPRQPPTESSSIFVHVPFSDPIFEGNFGGLLVLKMGHAAYRRKAHDV